MSKSRRGKEGLLARVNFPLYCVQMLTSRHVLVAGGGGSAKTGVKNGFEIFEVSHNGESFVAEEVMRHETGGSVVMNCASYSDGKRCFLMAGQESHCQLYRVGINISAPQKIGQENEKEEATTLKKRRRSSSTSDKAGENKAQKQKVDSNSNSYKSLEFTIAAADSIQTDFGSDEPLQRVVRVSNSGRMVATAGTDGHVRLWSFPALKLLHDIEAHCKELDDLDFSPNDAMLVSISKDAAGIIWDCATGKKVTELKWETPEKVKYLFKRCRFGQVEGDKMKARLFMLSNPARRSKLSSFIQFWNPKDGTIVRSCPSTESLSALAVSDDGRFVAVGTMFTGTVDMYIAFSLQRVLHVAGAHSMFVTGLSFLPSADDGCAVMGSCTEAAVVSISVDNQICIHALNERSTMPSWVAVLVIIGVLFLTFVLCSFFDL